MTLKDYSRAMRENPTLAERKLWQALRVDNLGVRFRRQTPIGRYIADFVCFERRLIVELDGSQHLDSRYDADRDAWFASQGFRTLRFWNDAVLKEMPLVLDAIMGALTQDPASTPLPALRATSSTREEEGMAQAQGSRVRARPGSGPSL